MPPRHRKTCIRQFRKDSFLAHQKYLIVTGGLLVRCYKAVPAWNSESNHPLSRPREDSMHKFLMTSVGKSAQESRIHCKMLFLGGAFKFPAAVSSWMLSPAIHRTFQCTMTWMVYSNLRLASVCIWCNLPEQSRDRFSWISGSQRRCPQYVALVGVPS